MKLVLEGARIVHRDSPADRLDDKMRKTGKWQVVETRVMSSVQNADDPAANVHKVFSVEEALAATAPCRNWASYKRYPNF